MSIKFYLDVWEVAWVSFWKKLREQRAKEFKNFKLSSEIEVRETYAKLGFYAGFVAAALIATKLQNQQRQNLRPYGREIRQQSEKKKLTHGRG